MNIIPFLPHMYKQLFIGLVAWKEKYLQKKDGS